MKVIADLHIHSRFAMACSSMITVDGIDTTCKQKGVKLIGTGDFAHPTWMKELKERLEPAEEGFFRVKGSQTGVRFVLSAEVSTVYNANNDSKRIHHCMLAPDFESADAINDVLSKKGDLASDGRAQISMSSAELVESVMGINKDTFVFPAHIWTPFFGALGVYSRYNSLKEVYEDQEKHIHALEQGLSADPAMNWRISALDKYTLLSNSDMHSLPKIGREANVFEMDEDKFSYGAITDAMKSKDTKRIKMNIEFFPEEGKYHYDGHRQCMFSVDPEHSNIKNCPVCGKRLTIGVLHRVNDLADRPPGYVPSGSVPYVKLVPLLEIIAYALKKTAYSPLVAREYEKLVGRFGKEFEILMDTPESELSAFTEPEIAKAIINVRNGNISISPGYDGNFGVLDLLNRDKDKAQQNRVRQKPLFG
jgi:uncharacterized protein (TIGR00375 family)